MPPEVSVRRCMLPQNRSSAYMATRTTRVNSVDDLIAATNNDEVEDIVLSANLSGVPSIALLPGQSLRSESDERPDLIFLENTDGTAFIR
jgi:hypothetical protein